MPVLPVVTRELRASSRQPFTFHLRTLAASAFLASSLVFGLNHGFGAEVGAKLFANLHLTMVLSTWILVPLMTADCITRERREGTLGLLFLTRLRSSDVIIAKGVAHGLRALTMWLAVLPVLMIPLLLGGVSSTEAMMSVLINLSCLCGALAAGLLASAYSRTWVRALIRAGILSLLLIAAIALLAGTLFHYAVAAGGISGGLSLLYRLAMGIGLLSNQGTAWRFGLQLMTKGQMLWLMTMVTLGCSLGLLLAITLAGYRIRRSWQEEPPSAGQLWLQRQFCTPMFWVSFFRRWMRWKIQHNPIGWLEQRTWSGRLVTWAWFAIIMSIYSAVFTDKNFFRGHDDVQRTVGWLLAGSLALSAAGSFRRERESGVLELLLVSPLGESQIISGRVSGLWGQFLPAFGLLLGIWSYFKNLFSDVDLSAIAFFAVAFMTLPVIGLYHSLRWRSFLAAFLMTLVTGLLAPLLIPPVMASLLLANFAYLDFGFSGFVLLGQLLLALFFWYKLWDRLKRRTFPLER